MRPGSSRIALQQCTAHATAHSEQRDARRHRPMFSKNFLTPSSQPLLARIVPLVIAAQGLVELTQQVLLLGRQIDRRLDHHATEQVSDRAAAHRANALFAQAKHSPGLRLRRNLERHVSIQSWHVDLAAENRRREADRHLAGEVTAIALEDRVLADLNLDVQITGRSTVAPGFPFTGEADPIPVVDTGRNLTVRVFGRRIRP